MCDAFTLNEIWVVLKTSQSPRSSLLFVVKMTFSGSPSLAAMNLKSKPNSGVGNPSTIEYRRHLYSIVDGLPTPEFGFDLEFIAARDGEPLKVILATKRRDDRELWEV